MATLPGMAERTVTISGASKTFAVTGWRIGWAIAPAEVSGAIRKVHDFLTVGAPAPLMEAVAVALDELAAGLLRQARLRVLPGGATCCTRHWSASGFRAELPDGAYYILADYSALSDLPDTEFARWLTTEIGVTPVPGSSFFSTPDPARRLVRFAFCKREETLRQAAERLGNISMTNRDGKGSGGGFCCCSASSSSRSWPSTSRPSPRRRRRLPRPSARWVTQDRRQSAIGSQETKEGYVIDPALAQRMLADTAIQVRVTGIRGLQRQRHRARHGHGARRRRYRAAHDPLLRAAARRRRLDRDRRGEGHGTGTSRSGKEIMSVIDTVRGCVARSSRCCCCSGQPAAAQAPASIATRRLAGRVLGHCSAGRRPSRSSGWRRPAAPCSAWAAPSGRDELDDYELMLIRAKDGRVDYEAHPMMQPTAVFTATVVSDTLLQFENPRHDFPQAHRLPAARRGLAHCAHRRRTGAGRHARSCSPIVASPAPARPSLPQSGERLGVAQHRDRQVHRPGAREPQRHRDRSSLSRGHPSGSRPSRAGRARS